MKKKIICFDIDGVICKTKSNHYNKSSPHKNNIKIINSLYNKGFIIKLYTARCMGRNNDNKLKAEKQIKKLTIEQLKKWKVKYHKIFFGKPSFDIFVDDKSLFFKKKWASYFKQTYDL